MDAKASCAVCKKAIAARTENAFFPFCGARCRQVDLGRWLNEDYRIASKPEEDEDGSSDDA
jgi:uncharacterized protein